MRRLAIVALLAISTTACGEVASPENFTEVQNKSQIVGELPWKADVGQFTIETPEGIMRCIWYEGIDGGGMSCHTVNDNTSN